MTTNITSQFTSGNLWARVPLRLRLFIASALLSSLILIIVAWVINSLVVRQARQQVQAEVENLLPVYNAVWEENARNLASVGTTMANSSITKAVFGNPRAAQDRATIHELIADLSSETTVHVDLILLSDGAGQITFAEIHGENVLPQPEMIAAREAGANQKQMQGIAKLGDKLYQLALTPILLQSGQAEIQNTLAVLGTGVELNREVAEMIRQRIHSGVVFWLSNAIYASSFATDSEQHLANLIRQSDLAKPQVIKPVELELGGASNLAFARPLTGFDGQHLGQVIIIRSLEEAGRLFQSISNSLWLLWSLSIAAAFGLSYLIAGRIVQPIAPLIQSTREVGAGNYDHEIKVEATGELGELATAFEQMRRSLKHTQAELLKRERLATIGQMASSIVHDLRNPLAAISTAAEMLQRDNLSVERRHTLVESQLRASQRMQEMLRELLDYTRGNYSLDLEHHRLSRIVERALQTVSATRTGVSVEANIPSELVVTVDSERLRRVFENLLSNAVQAMSQQASERRIKIQAMHEADRIRIDIIDSGPGISPEIKERLFEPFVSQGKLGGTGLGLAIAKSIVEAHGGSIGLATSEIRGANFFLLLPQTGVQAVSQ